MKIELIKDHTHGIHNWVKGAIVSVEAKLGNSLVTKKKARVIDDAPIKREPEPKEKEATKKK